MMHQRHMLRLAVLALTALLAACSTTDGQAPRPATAAIQAEQTRPPVTILISIDGFRPDYLDRGVTPNLSRLAAEGVRGTMRPSFPSKTFPNHYTVVTGLRPDRHGIVANTMEDAARPKEIFTMATEDPFWWNGAEPIWVTAEKAGIRSATMFWPGSSVAVGGMKAADWPYKISGGTRPSDWQGFAQAVTDEQRVRAVMDWMRRPAAIRPRLVTLYFDSVDTAGHDFGPDDQRTNQAVQELDGAIGQLLDGLRELRQPANIIITADHGMAPISSERLITLDGWLDPADYRAVETGPYASFHALPGREAALEAKLFAPHPHMTCWRKSEIPARLAYGKHPRVPPYLCLAESGWMIVKTTPGRAMSGGNHGYDNADPLMAAIFIAHGPAFAEGRTVPMFDNVDIQPMLAGVLGIAAPHGDGSDATWRTVKR